MNYLELEKSSLFHGINRDEAENILSCINALKKTYKKDETIYMAGEYIDSIGIVVKGKVHIENYDIFGGKSIFTCIEAGGIFGESYALIPNQPLMVDVSASENCEILFININKLLNPCENACYNHKQMILNLISMVSRKNFTLSRKIINTSSKSIRGRLISYLSEQQILHGGNDFYIPFDRQALADYLSVDRSAMCKELSKMKSEGMIDYKKNHFILKITEKNR